MIVVLCIVTLASGDVFSRDVHDVPNARRVIGVVTYYYYCISTFFDLARMDRLTLRGKSAVARFTLSTKPLNQDVKIYSTYGINFKLVGDFKYSISQ